MSIRFIYITAGSVDEAMSIGKTLVSERLAACANIIEPVRSVYWWEGRIRQDTEAIMVCKTRASLVQELIDRVTSLHSYEVPCVVSLPILEGHAPFLDWVSEETR